jgi:hypothetical protein
MLSAGPNAFGAVNSAAVDHDGSLPNVRFRL